MNKQSMTVGELVQFLSAVPNQDLPVFISATWDDNHNNIHCCGGDIVYLGEDFDDEVNSPYYCIHTGCSDANLDWTEIIERKMKNGE